MLIEKDAIVVGGGIAGLSIANALSKRNKRTVLLESQPEIGLAASGNAAGVAYPYLTKFPTPDSLFSLRAFSFLQETFSNLTAPIPYKLGVAFCFPEKDESRYTETIRSHSLDASIAELRDELIWRENQTKKVAHLWFPKGITYSPRDFLDFLRISSEEFLEIKSESHFHSFEKDGSGNFLVQSKDESIRAPLLFLAHGTGALAQSLAKLLPISKVRGQILKLGEFPESFLDKHALLFGGYLTADLGGGPLLGATYREFTDHLLDNEEETRELFDKVESFLPEDKFLWDSYREGKRPYLSRVQFRVQLSDRRPVLGSLPLSLENQNSEQGLFCALGFGSRGLNLAPFAGELVVSEALGETLKPEETELLREFSPFRFYRRKLKQGNVKTE